MPLTKVRTPPVWLVLLPALALAAVGVRAVTAEMRASEDAARDRARSVASRLARSVDALVAEYAGPLPARDAVVTIEEAVESTLHLSPRRALSAQGFAINLDSTGDATPATSASDSAVESDAMAAAERLASTQGGHVAAAALLAASARAVQSPAVSCRLLLTAAAHDLASGGSRDALSELDEVGRRGATFRDPDGTPLVVRALSLALPIVAAAPRDPLPTWISDSYARIAADMWDWDAAKRELTLDLVERTLGERLPESARAERATWNAARRIAASGATQMATMQATGRLPRLSVWTRLATSQHRIVLLGGDLPSSVVADRVGREAAALASETGVVSTRLVAPEGGVAFDSLGGTSSRSVVIERVSLAEPLSSWRAEAVVAPESGVPATAWLLGAAVVATTTALLAGTVALRRAAERSARLAEDRQTFLDHVAHELRTPAAAVQALTEELASGHVTPEREVVYREHLLRESRRLSNLVEDTLDFTRLDAGRLAFKMEPADLRDVVRRAIEESRDAGRVVATLPDAAVVRLVDEGALRRAVKNLVENAVRHGGGEEPVVVALEVSNGAASIAVTDHGRGIASEHMPRLFERFFRVPSSTHETKGVGLGLALCREVARAHGGDATVVSELGKGSTFTLRMPLA